MEHAKLKSLLSRRKPERLMPEGALRAAVALLLSPAGDGLELLFIRRAEHPADPWSGHIGLPGGTREPEDADDLATALRETSEEIGGAPPAEALVGQLDDLRPGNPKLPDVVIRPFVFRLAGRPAVTPSAEVAGHFWVNLRALKAAETRVDVAIGKGKKKVNAYRLRQGVVWGITRRIVRPLLEDLLRLG